MCFHLGANRPKGETVAIDFTKPTPLYKQIVDHIKSQIDCGEIHAGEQLDSQQSLASKYHVSLITIKRALNELINEKVLFSRIGKGTYVSTETIKSTFDEHVNIGLLLRDLNSPYFSRVIETIENRASELGFNLLVATSSNSPEKEDQIIKRFLEVGVHGLIIGMTTSRFKGTDIIQEMHAKDFPYVIISYVENDDLNYISTDHQYGAYLATEHLIKIGAQRIGYISTEEGYPLGEVRKRGFLEALDEYNKAYYPELEFRVKGRGEWQEYDSGYQIGQEVINASHPPEAMFIYNDLTALGFQKFLLEKGMRIPDDIAIIGFDNIMRGQIAPIPLSTIEQPITLIGKKAVDSIYSIKQNQEVEFPIILRPTLIVRESTNGNIKKSERKRKTNVGHLS